MGLKRLGNVPHAPHLEAPAIIAMLSHRILQFAPFIGFLASGLVASAQSAPSAPKRTEMAPFTVEAEFGVDGLRIQNSQSVLNPHLLEQHGVTQLQDIAGIAPNLFSSNSDSRGFGDILALRGTSNSLFFSAPSVAYFIDDVPGGSVSSYPSALLGVESFVVKAGPQGTDYGRNAPGGAIDIKTRAPGNRHQGKLQLDLGSYALRDVQMAIDGPINAKVGYSASIGVSEREGYIENTFLRRSADDRSALTGRAALYLKPDPSLQLRFGVVMENFDDDATRLTSLFSRDPFVVASDLNGVTELERRQLSFQSRKTFGSGTLIATTSWQDFDLGAAVTDLDLSPAPAASSRVAQQEEMWTQELRFESTPTTDGAQWRAGLFYSDNDTEGNALRQFIVPPGPFVPPGFVQTERTVFALGRKSLAGYANADHPLSSATTVKFGVRLERAESDIDRTKASSNSFGFPSPQDARLNREQNKVYGSATLGFVHTVSESLNLMARTSLAQKPEGFSAFTANPVLTRFNDERQWANEIGLTFSPARSRFGGSVLGFWNRISGYQFERTVPGSTDFVVVNANRVTARGVEAKFMWNPVDRVWWDFQAGYTEAKFDAHQDSTGRVVNGNQVPFIPRSTLRTGVTVDLGGGFSANASYAAVGRTYYDERNTAMFSQPAHGIANAQLRYRFDRWAVTVYGHNLFEKNYYQFINPEIFAGSPGSPRRIGVRLSFTY